MSGKPIVLAITSEGVGGAEQRLSEVWLELAPKLQNLRMLVRKTTLEQLIARPALRGLERYRDRITTVEAHGKSYPATLKAFAPALWRLPRGSVVHHILQAPPLLHRIRGHRVVISWVSTFFPPPFESLPSFNNWLISAQSLRAADLIDVLNPEMLPYFQRSSNLAPKLRLTVGGTIVHGDSFKPGAKRDEVVFLGRIEKYKNALAFVSAIPTIAKRLESAGKRAAFRLYGPAADQGGVVRKKLKEGAYRGLDIEWSQTSDPAAALAPAKVFASLQFPSNYPSKALAEAMAAGCVPVISDSGESRRMADPACARFVPAHFTSEELAQAVVEILSLSDADFASLSAAVRKDALKRFRVEPQADYFAGLYRELSGEG